LQKFHALSVNTAVSYPVRIVVAKTQSEQQKDDCRWKLL